LCGCIDDLHNRRGHAFLTLDTNCGHGSEISGAIGPWYAEVALWVDGWHTGIDDHSDGGGPDVIKPAGATLVIVMVVVMGTVSALGAIATSAETGVIPRLTRGQAVTWARVQEQR